MKLSIHCDPESDSPRYIALRAEYKHNNFRRARLTKTNRKKERELAKFSNRLRAQNTGNSYKTYRGHNVDNRESAIVTRQFPAAAFLPKKFLGFKVALSRTARNDDEQ